jgi:hypothetical protein
VNQSYEVEYCNLELRFDRRLIQQFISSLIEEGYSLYWNENEHQFIIAIRSGRKLIKLKLDRVDNRYKLAGTYSFRDPKLSEMMEKMINDTKGHAVVKRFSERQILIENIMFGEIIKKVEISGIERKVVFEKGPNISMEHVWAAMRSTRVDERIPVLRLELDYELATLHELLEEGKLEEAERCKERIRKLRQEWIMSEAF